MDEEKKARRPGSVKKAVIPAAVLLVLLAAVMVILALVNRGGSGGELDSPDTLENFASFEAQSGSTFAKMGRSMVMVSSVEINVFDARGGVSYTEQFDAQDPAVVSCYDRAVAYDIGGTSFRVLGKNKVLADCTAEGRIISISVNEDGWIAVCTEAEGYKGAVTVYNSSVTAVYRWSSAHGYVYDASVSPNCRSVAVLTFDQQDESFISQINVLNIRRGTVRGTYKTENNAVLSLEFSANDVITCVAENSTFFLNGKGAERAVYEYGGWILRSYSLEGSSYAVLSFNRSASDMYSDTVAVSEQGKELGRVHLMGSVQSISCADRRIALLFSDNLLFFTAKMEEDGGVSDVESAKKVFLDSDGAILVAHTNAKFYSR